MMASGEYGGVALRSLKTAGGALPPGSEISAETAMSWPVANRHALANSGTVRWHTRPASDDATAYQPTRRGRPPKVRELE